MCLPVIQPNANYSPWCLNIVTGSLRSREEIFGGWKQQVRYRDGCDWINCVWWGKWRNQNMCGGRSKKEPENIVMGNMSEQMRFKKVLFPIYLRLPSKLGRKLESNLKTYSFSKRIHPFLYVPDPRKEWTVPTMWTAFSTSNIREGRKEEKQGVLASVFGNFLERHWKFP